MGAPAPGRDVEKVMLTDGRIAPRRAVKILTQVCKAIQEAHQANQMHRDH